MMAKKRWSSTPAGQHIPGHEIIMEELGHKGERKARMEQLINTFLSEINTAGSGMEPTLPDTKDGPKENTDGRLNMLVHRILLLNSFDLRTAEIFAAEDSISQRLTPDELRQAMAQKATGSYSSTLPTVASKKKGKAKSSAEDEAPKLGVDQVNHLRAMDPDGGLTYIWNLTMYRPHHVPPPADRAGMVYWASNKSPMLTRIVELVTNNARDGRRTLIVVDNQVLWFLNFFQVASAYNLSSFSGYVLIYQMSNSSDHTDFFLLESNFFFCSQSIMFI